MPTLSEYMDLYALAKDPGFQATVRQVQIDVIYDAWQDSFVVNPESSLYVSPYRTSVTLYTKHDESRDEFRRRTGKHTTWPDYALYNEVISLPNAVADEDCINLQYESERLYAGRQVTCDYTNRVFYPDDVKELLEAMGKIQTVTETRRVLLCEAA